MKIQVEKLIESDGYLADYREALERRSYHFLDRLEQVEAIAGDLLSSARGWEYFGVHAGEHEGKKGAWYREWAPGALNVSLVGEFNGWDRLKDLAKKDKNGVWNVFIPSQSATKLLSEGSTFKCFVAGKLHSIEKIPAYTHEVEVTENGYCARYVSKIGFDQKHKSPKLSGALRIYEAHVGMAQEKLGFGSFEEFRKNVLPRIVKLNYNAVQFMAIAEHPYYGSFGYQVTNFFAVSHFFGTRTEFARLVDEAHERGLVVLMDVVHSHASMNIREGLNEFDGTGGGYFLSDSGGYHPDWNTRLFNYGNSEVLRFLLSNLQYWMEVFGVDGFRFDGVTSMLYQHHGLNMAFDHYDHYFRYDDEVNLDAMAYLMIANTLVHKINPDAITIAEDVSGMPGIARSIEEGGLGFDYRLAMAAPDYWIKTVKHVPDEKWSMQEMVHELTHRRSREKHVGYCESHDQALVGDKTLAFWLMDQEMYSHMNQVGKNLVIDRGMALHKMIRMVTWFLGGEAWLNFMGNEFGHPEWVDFPREGNGYSHFWARRQWSLVDNKELGYQKLNSFDAKLQKIEDMFGVLGRSEVYLREINEEKKLISAERNGVVGVFNFHQSESYGDWRVGVAETQDYQVVLSTDEVEFGGFGKVSKGSVYPIQQQGWNNCAQSVQIYTPARTGQFFVPVSRLTKD